MLNIQAIEDLINMYANSKDSSFLIRNLTEEFLAVRQIGDHIPEKKLVGIFDNKDLIAKSSELFRIKKIEVFIVIDYVFFTLYEIFGLKGNQNKHHSNYKCFLEIKQIFGNILGCKDYKEIVI